MKIYITSILATSVIVEGGFVRSNLNNGQECTKSDQCKSKCCSKVSQRRHKCVRKTDDTVCTEKNIRNVPGSGEDWLDAINEVRQEYQEEFGGTYIPLKWSPDLAAEAQKWANDIAEICKNGTPGTRKNPNDFGVSTILNMRNPQLAVDRWVQNGLAADNIPSTKSNPFTQMLWATTEYVGCADVQSNLSGKLCTASVCYYAYAGNCGWNRHADWRDAVIDIKAWCSTVCASDGECAKIKYS